MKELRANLDQHREMRGEFTEETFPLDKAKHSNGIISGGESTSLPSFAQEQLWFVDQLHPRTPAYNIPTAIRLRGCLDRDALNRAIGQVIRQHDALRSAFGVADGKPVLRIAPLLNFDLTTVDLTGRSEVECETRWRDVWREDFERGFELEVPPLFRARLVRLAGDEHVLLWNAHHIIYDMWSHGVFLRDLAEQYEAEISGRSNQERPNRFSYADYARRQRVYLGSEEMQRDLEYWKRQLEGIGAPLQLPSDFLRSGSMEHEGRAARREWPAELTKALRLRCREAGVTLHTLLLAAYAILLHRYTGEEDFVIGLPVSDRTEVEFEGTIGLFLNTIALRVRCDARMSARALLRQVQSTVLDACDHQRLPFARLVEALRPVRGAGGDPLFRVMFDYQSAPLGMFEGGGVLFEPLEAETRTAKYDLTLLMKETGRGLLADLEYRSGRFHRETAVRLMEHLQCIAEGLAADLDQRLIDLPILGDWERACVVVQWNATDSEYPRRMNIADVFEAEAARRPEAVALVYEPGTEQRLGGLGSDSRIGSDVEQVTYAELNRRANRLAHRLREAGVGAGTTVGVCAERSMETVVALLAILKAGGAYLALDPGYPKERLAFMIADSNARVVLGRKINVEIGGNVDWIRVDDVLDSYSEANPRRRSDPDDLAYVIYTSGSTGQPKGVLVPHRGVLRLVKGADYFVGGEDEVFLQFAPLTFDASTFEIWAPLLNGGRLVLMPPNPVSLEDLGKAITRFGVTTLWLTSGLFHVLVDERIQVLRNVRRVYTGGDVLSVPRVERFLREVPGVDLINCYGPTENTTFTTWYRIPPEPIRQASIPIGKPIANTRVYILDSELKPQPIGVPGELCIGGDGLALGYLNAPELTAAKFVQAPAILDPGGRLYRTGDNARWLADGNIEFLGRRDHQVKIRGFRIELGEVESALVRHPAVKEAVVVVQGTEAEAKLLAAYWVAASDPPVSIDSLREDLRRHLPDYMVPSLFLRLDAFPLTENGKIDRRALPALTDGQSEEDYKAPRNAIEQRLVELWRAMFGRERVGRDDDFFMLGGHSLLATQLAARISDVFGVSIPLGTLFEARTIARLAVAIESASPMDELPPIVKRTRKPANGPERSQVEPVELFRSARKRAAPV